MKRSSSNMRVSPMSTIIQPYEHCTISSVYVLYEQRGALEGRIKELSSNMGKLTTTTAECLNFKSEQCYLLGISLKHFKLSHILLIGESLDTMLNCVNL